MNNVQFNIHLALLEIVSMQLPIPHPPRKPITGNLHQISGKPPIQTILELSKDFGPLFELKLFNKKLVVVTGQELFKEVCDEKRFHKIVAGPVEKLRVLLGDGLFTAHNDEPNWQKAHHILLPGMSMAAMKGYFPRMLEVAWKLVDKWNLASHTLEDIDVPDDMSRVTFDTIGLCGFDFDFRSFESDVLHDFVESMNYCLEETMRKYYTLPFATMFEFKRKKHFKDSILLMNKTVDDVINERRLTKPTDKIDFLNLMLHGVDKKTQNKLDDENIRNQVLTFLIAGHETTSGLLSFALHFLINDPVVLQKAYDEVDKVLGADLSASIEYRKITELKYIAQILKEALRLWPPAAGFRITAHENTMLGKYAIKKGQMLLAMLPAIHRDPAIWGNEPDRFNPDHFSEVAEANRPSTAFKPFGNGMRACIGRQFAMVEATLILAMILQRFSFINHTHYKLKIKELVTIKPEDFKIKIVLRKPEDRKTFAASTTPQHSQPAPNAANAPSAAKHDTPLLVLYGSNMGTSEEMAKELCNEGLHRGFKASLSSLDAYTAPIPRTGAVIIICSTYNGNPPDNALQFVKKLSDESNPTGYNDVKYTVMGCGNSDWNTFQIVPRMIDAKLTALGAKRIHPLGEGDAKGDFERHYEHWHQTLWTDIESACAINPTSDAPLKATNLLQVDFFEYELAPYIPMVTAAHKMKVIKNEELQQVVLSGRSTKHIEVELPYGITYQPGDHLGVLPRNSTALVQRVAKRFKLNPGVVLKITIIGEGNTTLPINQKIRLQNLLEDFVELQEIITRKQLKTLIDYTVCPPEKNKLVWLLQDDVNGYMKHILEKRRSLVDVLEEFPACEIPFATFLELLPSLRPRYYSISSSHHQYPQFCSITVSVLDVPAKSGNGNYKGTCSNYLATIPPGNYIDAFTKEPISQFRLPADASIPIIMVGPGTGFAPFRGFLQERQWLKDSGNPLGKAMLFYGCRHHEQDFIYREELHAFENNGIAQVVTAFSRQDDQPKEYVQHKMWQHKEEVWQMIEEGGIVYVCGDGGKMEPDVRNTLEKIYKEKTGDTTNSWVDTLITQQRFLTDVWVSY